MTMTRDRIEELKRLYAAMTNCEMYGEEGAAKGVMVPQSLLDQFERALAERALEPQGQALPELPEGRSAISLWYEYGSVFTAFTTDDMHAYARAYASQLALPAGPVPEGLVLMPMHLNAEMRDVLSEEDWTWEDLLVAANAVTEEQYYAIQSGDDGSPAVAQPVADERADLAQKLRERYGTPWRMGSEKGYSFGRHPLIGQAVAALCQPAEEGDKA